MTTLPEPAALRTALSLPWAICDSAVPLSWPPAGGVDAIVDTFGDEDEMTVAEALERVGLRPTVANISVVGTMLAEEELVAQITRAIETTDLGPAEGGVVTRPTVSLLGEAGPETVVPLANVSRETSDSDSASPAAGPGDGFDDSPDVIVIRAAGLILPRVHPVYMRYGYAVGAEQLAMAIETAARAAKAVVVLFDSPGGSVAGVEEAAARIAAVSGGDVPVVAVADHLMASAAYYLAAACTAIVASPSAQVGSVGVRMLRPSYARYYDEMGVDIDALYRGEGKLDYLIYVELDEDGRARLQAGVDAYYDEFVSRAASGRGVSRRVVEDTWGAQLYTAQAARAVRMVDEVRSARDVIARCGNAAGRRRYKAFGATATLETNLLHKLRTEPEPEEGP